MSLGVLLLGPLAPIAVTAGTAASGYPGLNILSSQILKPWRSTSTAADSVIIDLGSSQFVDTIAIQDVNCANCAVFADNTNPPTTVRSTLLSYSDGQNRFRGHSGISASVRYIKIATSGTPNDGAAYWRIGAFYAFASNFSLPRDPLFGGTQVDYVKPQSRIDMDNGAIVRDSTGPGYALITADYSGGNTDDMEQVAEYARAGLCWIDFVTPSATNRAMQWPVRHFESKITRKINMYNREGVQIVLKEEV